MLKISKRLCTVASLVRNGAVVADIGTDHAYLPIYLIKEDIAKRAVASDINVGPLNTAKENIHKYGLANKIETHLGNGLEGIEKYEPTDVLICGMGGELIASIIEKADFVKKKGIRLILQPMTMVRELREYLSNGFSTIAENVVFEDEKLYQVLCLQYDGNFHPLTREELELGKLNIENGGEEFRKLLFSTIAKYQKKVDGIKLGGGDTADLEEYIEKLRGLYENL